jgi:hypothetical protein
MKIDRSAASYLHAARRDSVSAPDPAQPSHRVSSITLYVLSGYWRKSALKESGGSRHLTGMMIPKAALLPEQLEQSGLGGGQGCTATTTTP